MATLRDGLDETVSNIHPIYHDSTKEELEEVYKKWSKTYDEDSKTVTGYVAPKNSAKLLFEKMIEFGYDLNARILDMGSGTGLVGEALHAHGYRNIDAVDLSQESLDVAKKKGVYKNLIRGLMASEKSVDLGVKSNEYEAAICIGVFSIGHVRAKGFDDFVHVLKSGGLVCFSVRDDVLKNPEYGYLEKMEELSREKKWKCVHKVHDVYKSSMGAWLYVYQKL